jgi:phosphotransferase system HPr (HPr) family protein
MREERILVINEVGLHARPAAVFVRMASQYKCAIQVRNNTLGSEWVNAKSILSVLTLGVERDQEVALRLDGQDEDEAADAILGLIQSDFAA